MKLGIHHKQIQKYRKAANKRDERYHGGPVVRTATKNPARTRGLKRTGDIPKTKPVRVIVQNGVVINPKAFKRLSPELISMPLASTGKPLGQAGELAKTKPQSNPRDLDARER